MRSLLQVQLKNLVPEVYSVYYRSGGGLMCLCVCLCVCVQKNVCGARRLKKKINNYSEIRTDRRVRIRTDRRGCTDPYEFRRNYSDVSLTLIRNTEPDF